jgi:DNA-binding NtrC family response regulator
MAQGASPTVGDRVVVEVRLPRQAAVTAIEGEVAWAVPGLRDVEVGVRFSDPTSISRQLVQRFIEGFRARVVSVGPPLAPELADGMRAQCELEEVGADTLSVALADGLTSLVMSPVVGLEDVLQQADPLGIPVVALVHGEDVDALSRRHPRLVLHRVPTSPTLLGHDVSRTIDARSLELENERLSFELEFQAGLAARPALPQVRPPGVIGVSDAMQRVYAQLDRISRVDSSVVLLGETGTGKGLLARVLHESSQRSRRPLVTQNCAAVTETLLDSELFGSVRGAFTGAVSDRPGLFEAANGGTVFLDEIAEMSMGMQAKLLHVLQEGELRRVGASTPTRVDVRVVCATHADLETLVRERRFREDLYYRLVNFVIRLPPLRDRVPDVVPLARHFLVQFVARNRLSMPRLTADAERALEQAPWPGNVRQLQHLVERLCLQVPPGGVIDAVQVRQALGAQVGGPHANVLESELLERERALVQRALDDADGVIANAARALGMERSTLSRRLAKLGVTRRRPPGAQST